MKLEVSHITRYTYLNPVLASVNEIRLTPRTNYRQSCYSHMIVTEPASNFFSYEDFFHNRVNSFTIDKPHRELAIKMISTVVTHGNDNTQPTTMNPEEERRVLQDDTFQNNFIEYLLPTSYTELTPEIKAYSSRIADSGVSISDLIESIYTTINLDFVYDPFATSVQTTVGEMLKIKRGVCQDYTHFMIAICREKGIPARYVSGYHFVGDLQGGNADFTQASHAWVECYIPGTSCWFGYDPTNNCPLDWRYVKLGHGRDYNDIVPVKGVYRGSTFQNLEVSVDVRLVEGA